MAGAGNTDFTGVPNYTETDNCSPLPDLGKSCTITVAFNPQESCTWLPNVSQGGVPPAQCPLILPAALTLSNVPSKDPDTTFVVPITGIGVSAIQASTPELDFGAEEPLSPAESSPPQTLYFTNNSASPVQILQSSSTPCKFSPGQTPLPLPLTSSSYLSGVSGLQVVTGGMIYQANGSYNTVYYNCDADQQTELPNFVVSSDTCTGTNLPAGAMCSIQVAFVPQPATYTNFLDYFLELNTLQCSSPLFPSAATSDCELDSGRFPVELKANPPSPLRMAPSAGLDFGNFPVGQITNPLTITLTNDPNIANPQTVTFIGKITASGSFSEFDDCQATLAPGDKCTLTVTFKPSVVGFTAGNLTINYVQGPNNIVGNAQKVYLRGTGQ
jgi:hypothetical protein